MPPRPFPFPFRLGTDVCSVPRIRRIIQIPQPAQESSDGEYKSLHRFLSKLLTWPEQQHFWHRFKDASNVGLEVKQVGQFLAGRWAAKEACRKACEHLGLSNGFHSIMILPLATPHSIPSGATSRPRGLILRQRLPELPSDALIEPHHPHFDMESVDGQFCEVTISHDSYWATATAIVPMVDGWNAQDAAHEDKN